MRRVAVLCGLALATGCATYSQRDGEQLQAEVYAVKTRLDAMQEALDTLQAQQAEQSEQLSKLLSEVGDLNLDARRNDADFGVQLEQLLEQVARLKGSSSTLDERLSSLESATSKTREEFDLKLENLANPNKPEVGPSVDVEALVKSPKKALAEARSLLDKGAPGEARRLVRELVIKNEKKRSFSSYEPAAQFLIGETYFAEGEYRQAAAEYNKVRKAFPKSKYVPEAYLKLGMCFESLSLLDDAKLFYRTVTKQFPRSSAAKKARQRLARLEK